MRPGAALRPAVRGENLRKLRDCCSIFMTDARDFEAMFNEIMEFGMNAAGGAIAPPALRNTTYHLSSDHSAWMPEPSPTGASGRAFFTPSIASYLSAVRTEIIARVKADQNRVDSGVGHHTAQAERLIEGVEGCLASAQGS